MRESVHWGIVATGQMAASFAEGLRQVADAALVAVASRDQRRADDFGHRFGVPHRHGSYEDLASDSSVDVVYVATPQSRHRDDVLLFLEAGKPVLCEKPFALSERQAAEMIATARSRQLFLMEALWSRYLPAYVTLRELLRAGRIGQPRLVEADFGIVLPEVTTAHRLFDLSRGGGALLDLGVYPVQLASLVLGEPDRVEAVADIGSTGVDELVAAVLGYRDRALAVVKAALRTQLASTARITGTDGVIRLPAPMHCPSSLRVTTPEGTETLDRPFGQNGWWYQVVEVHECMRQGRLESNIMPLDESRSIMRTLDRIRAEIGLRFPEERQERGPATT